MEIMSLGQGIFLHHKITKFTHTKKILSKWHESLSERDPGSKIWNSSRVKK